MQESQSKTIPVPDRAQKAVFDGAFASPLVTRLTVVRRELNGDFDEEVFRLPADADWRSVDEFYEKSASAGSWRKKEVRKSEVSNVTVTEWERGSFFDKKRFAVVYVELDASHGDDRKFLAVYTEKNK